MSVGKEGSGAESRGGQRLAIGKRAGDKVREKRRRGGGRRTFWSFHDSINSLLTGDGRQWQKMNAN